MAEADPNPKPVRPIIIIKKKARHAAHHGGAWKVAYADFVTAMMALFIVLWLLNTSKKIQESISGYFRDPKGFAERASSDMHGAGESFLLSRDDMPKLKEELQRAVHRMSNFDKLKNQVEMTVTAEGLRIELLESSKGTFFDSGSDLPTSNGTELLAMLAQELGKLPNKISVEGHTDSKHFLPKWDYSNWELSIDRANAARRLMQSKGVRADQIAQVRGFADQHLRKPDQPRDDSNRRVSVIVQYMDSVLEDKEMTKTATSVLAKPTAVQAPAPAH
jgi:chemotaxis protein MotB